MGAKLGILHIWFKHQSRGEASLILQDRPSYKNACVPLYSSSQIRVSSENLARHISFPY